MPWKDRSVVQLRKEFVLKALAQEAPFSTVCRRYGISRKTGYKWLERFRERGLEGLIDESRRPLGSPFQTTSEIALEVIRLRKAHPTWGAKKIRRLLTKELGRGVEMPSVRTIARVLERVHLIRKKRRKRAGDQGWALQAARKKVGVEAPNDLWTVDFKGWWMARDGRRCEPLTVRDAFSRFVLALCLLPRSDTEGVQGEFERLFEKHGVPKVIQSDNGSPFAAARSLAGLTRLSAWWISLGIDVVRSRPGCPQDNGAHERMHADIRIELQQQAASSIVEQQKACDEWRAEFNHVRPHEALGMQTPAEVYRPSERRVIRALVGGFPDDARIFNLGAHGKLWFEGHDVFVSMALRYRQVGLQRTADGTLLVWFHHVMIGWLRITPGMPRQITVQPLPVPGWGQASASGGDGAGDKPLPATEVLPAAASPLCPGTAGGDTRGDTSSAVVQAAYLPNTLAKTTAAGDHL
jgi:transposase InsO family protein